MTANKHPRGIPLMVKPSVSIRYRTMLIATFPLVLFLGNFHKFHMKYNEETSLYPKRKIILET